MGDDIVYSCTDPLALNFYFSAHGEGSYASRIGLTYRLCKSTETPPLAAENSPNQVYVILLCSSLEF